VSRTHRCILLWTWDSKAPGDKQDVFASTACPAFLTFTNAAYLAGVTVELPCYCKPQEVSVVWFFQKRGSTDTRVLSDHQGNRLLDTSHIPQSSDLHSRFTIRLFSLLIFRVGPADSGLYICGSTNGDFFFGYDLDVQEAQTVTLTQRSAGEAVEPLLTYLYQVFTSFQPWSVCDRCGVPGEQVRVGLCYVRSRFLHVRYRQPNQTAASCGSGALPRAFQTQMSSRTGARLEIKSCQVTCEFVSDSLPVPVPVLFLNHPADRDLVLECPGARPNTAVAWDHGSKPIYRSEHLPGGNSSTPPPRLWIDTGHHLVFQPTKAQDSGVYYCWLEGHRAAEIHLLVYSHLGRGQSLLSHPDFPAAVQTVLKSYAAMTALFCLLLFCRAGIKHLTEDATHSD
uniref:Family with sequence similarity 187 member A n=1 Tax=Nothobranchius furzeri TaxID=105023 RepID=A0A8C6P3A8_NOTFU